MKKSSSAAFTLIEMMTVIAVIVILTGMVLSISGYATRKGALARATGEIEMLTTACESYKSDNGNYPREILDSGSGVTDLLSPKQHFSPVSPIYTNASLFLYKQLSGDKLGQGGSSLPDGITDENETRYFKDVAIEKMLSTKKNATTKAIIQVNYIQDPFGFSYGYSTVAAKLEEDFQKQLKLGSANAKRKTDTAQLGFNAGSFDLWSTAGDNTTASLGSETSMGLKWAKWVKNW